MSVSVLFLATHLLQNPSLQFQWQRFADTSLHVSFEYPTAAKIVRRVDMGGLGLSVTCPDSIHPTIWDLLGQQTVLSAQIGVTRMHFDEAAKNVGLTKDTSGWSIYANPGSGPALGLDLINDRTVTTLKGFQAVGQNAFGDGGVQVFAEIARVPYQFVFIQSSQGNNLSVQVWYDPLATETLQRILSSIRVLG